MPMEHRPSPYQDLPGRDEDMDAGPPGSLTGKGVVTELKGAIRGAS